MKILITYFSKTNNTKIFAEKIHDLLVDKAEVEIVSMDKRKRIDYSKYDLVFLGSWINKNTVITPAKEEIRKLYNKNLILFATAGAYPDSAFGKTIINNLQQLPNNCCQLMDVILLNGYVDKKIFKMLDYIPSAILPLEKRMIMEKIMKESRYPSALEYHSALNRCELAFKKAKEELN